MARKKKTPESSTPETKGYIKGAGEIVEQEIDDTIEVNFMPYAMSVIMSRALPEIDGFKPSHRKLLYTMYKMGLLNGDIQKCAKIAGATMSLNPHGDAAIYDTLVRMTVAHEALLHPYIESKGSFGKAYSRDTAPAASRYTEAKLAKISAELFRDIDSDAVDMVDNFDGTMKEPSLLPVTFPSVLCNSNLGIAVGMACNICSFNLSEVIETTIALINDPEHNIETTLLAPDFPGGGFILQNQSDLKSIYDTGRGNVRVRSRYTYDKSANCIDITQIPPTTSIEAIVEKVIELVKLGKIKEISDIRDEQGKDGLRITIDLKRGVDPDKLMTRLFKLTPLEDSFSCNFNVLIAGTPKVMGVRELLQEWIAFRTECVRRRTYFELGKLKDKLHLLSGLSKILLDIDRAIQIIRETEEESEVVPNLMIGFGIDEIQAEYVAEIKLRHINREYILKRIADVDKLKEDIAGLEDILSSNKKVQKIIIKEMKEVAEKYGQPRRSMILCEEAVEEIDDVEEIPDYAVNLFLTAEGYFKKITPQSLRMSGEHKLKEGDTLIRHVESRNNIELLFFTSKCQVYKTKASNFSDTKASVLGEYVPAVLGMEEGEKVVYMAVVEKYEGYMVFAFDNGKLAKVEMSAYQTKTNRKKLINAYCGKFELVKAEYIAEDTQLLLSSSTGHRLIAHTGAITAKTTKDTQGVQVMTLRKNAHLTDMCVYADGMVSDPDRCRAKALPAAGAKEKSEQLSII